MNPNESYILIKFGTEHPTYIQPGISFKFNVAIGKSRFGELQEEATHYGSIGDGNVIAYITFNDEISPINAKKSLEAFINPCKLAAKEVKAQGNKLVYIGDYKKIFEGAPFTKYATQLEECFYNPQTLTIQVDLMPKVNELLNAVKEIKASKLEGSFAKLSINANPQIFKKVFLEVLSPPKKSIAVIKFLLNLFKSLAVELDLNSAVDDSLLEIIKGMIGEHHSWEEKVSEVIHFLMAYVYQLEADKPLSNARSFNLFVAVPPCYTLEIDLKLEGLAELISENKVLPEKKCEEPTNEVPEMKVEMEYKAANDHLL